MTRSQKYERLSGPGSQGPFESSEYAADKAGMAISQRQRRVIGGELRDVIFRVCSGGGAFLGLRYALKHADTKPRTSQICKPHIGAHGHLATHAFGQCLGSSVASEVLAWMAPVLIGAGLGAGVGFLLASMVRVGRRPPVRSR